MKSIRDEIRELPYYYINLLLYKQLDIAFDRGIVDLVNTLSMNGFVKFEKDWYEIQSNVKPFDQYEIDDIFHYLKVHGEITCSNPLVWVGNNANVLAEISPCIFSEEENYIFKSTIDSVNKFKDGFDDWKNMVEFDVEIIIPLEDYTGFSYITKTFNVALLALQYISSKFPLSVIDSNVDSLGAYFRT